MHMPGDITEISYLITVHSYEHKYLLISVYMYMPGNKLGKNCTDEFTLLKFK